MANRPAEAQLVQRCPVPRMDEKRASSGTNSSLPSVDASRTANATENAALVTLVGVVLTAVASVFVPIITLVGAVLTAGLGLLGMVAMKLLSGSSGSTIFIGLLVVFSLFIGAATFAIELLKEQFSVLNKEPFMQMARWLQQRMEGAAPAAPARAPAAPVAPSSLPSTLLGGSPPMEPPTGTLGIPAKLDRVITEADNQAQEYICMEEVDALVRETLELAKLEQALSAPGEMAENATNADPVTSMDNGVNFTADGWEDYIQSPGVTTSTFSNKLESKISGYSKVKTTTQTDGGADAGPTNESPSQQQPTLPDGWISVSMGNGAYTYYTNLLTNETVWKRPTAEDLTVTDPPAEND
jgi:ABC-type multidrug transport system fused ATPase/permease subunit